MIAIFPGQGSQFVGMGKELYADFALVRETFEEASDALQISLKKLCFDSAEADLKKTENTQPALLTVSVAAYRIAQKETGFTPKLVAGHSLGEYSALVCSGALSFAAAARWVRFRGEAMQRAVPLGEGTMAAVLGLSSEAVEKACAQIREQNQGIVEPANYNAPDQTVIAGQPEAVLAATALLKDPEKLGFPGARCKVIPLQVSAPFHCQMMKPAAEELRNFIVGRPESEKPKSLPIAYIANRTGRLVSDASLVVPLLIEQVDHSVRWSQSVEWALQAGHTSWVEFGPGNVLQGLVKRIASAYSKEIQTRPCFLPDHLKTL